MSAIATTIGLMIAPAITIRRRLVACDSRWRPPAGKALGDWPLLSDIVSPLNVFDVPEAGVAAAEIRMF